MRYQRGWLTKKSGSWLGHFNRRLVNASTGEIVRQQPAFVIGRVADLTKAQAMRQLRERVEAELGLRADSRTTLQWFIEHRWQPLREGTWRESTRATNLWVLGVINKRFGSTALEDIDAVALQGWLNELAKQRSGSLVKHARIFLLSILETATEDDYLRKNPAKRLRIPILKPVSKTFLTLPQITKLLKAAKDSMRDWTLLRLMLVTGLRPSELFALKWDSFDTNQSLLNITQTVYRGKVRPFTKTTEAGSTDKEWLTVLVPKIVAADLEKWRSESLDDEPYAYIFSDTGGGFLWKENYQQRVLNPLAKTAHIPKLNFQVLRRSVATHAQHLGSPKDIASILRHRKTDTAQLEYVQRMEASVRQTAEKLAETLFESI